MKNKNKLNKSGSALIFTLFILSTIMIIVFGGATVAMSGLKMGQIQSQSTRAYFAAEAGAERLLYEFRYGSIFQNLDLQGEENVFGTTTMTNGASYIVNYDQFEPSIRFTSIGIYENTRRSVQVDF